MPKQKRPPSAEGFMKKLAALEEYFGPLDKDDFSPKALRKVREVLESFQEAVTEGPGQS